jgi:hypothetical protein
MTPAVDVPPPPERLNVLVFSLLSFCLIAFGLWLVSAGKSYREAYAEKTEGWRVGSTHTVELTLVREDKSNLGCAADRALAGMHCGYTLDGAPTGPASAERSQFLQPYNTIDNTLLLGSGLWNAADLKGTLPEVRFTVTCNYNIKGLAKSASIRFDATAPFTALQKAVTVGTLTDCVIVR